MDTFRFPSIMKQVFIVLFLATCVVQARAQFKNVVLDSEQAYEPSIAINKDDQKNIIASASPDNIYYTVNGGTSWEKIKLGGKYKASGNVVLLADFKGNFFCLHHSILNYKIQVVIRQSADGGKTWSEGILISTDTTRQAMRPAAAIDRKGNLFVTWTEFDNYLSSDENCTSRILLSRSSNGKKWSKPLELSQTKGNCKDDDQTTAGAMAAVMGGGQRAFAAWAIQEKVFFDRAFDAGETWLSNDIPVAEQAGGWRMEIPGLQKANGVPMLIIDNTKKSTLSGALYLTWADQLRGETDTDIWFTRSMNFGDNWSQPGRINNDVPGKHQYFPYMTLDSETGNLYILYYDRRNYINETTDVYLAFSKDAGATFKNVKISETAFVADAAVPLGNYIGISAHAGMITPVWTRIENGKSAVCISIIRQDELDTLK
jgi:hypothetical protein